MEPAKRIIVNTVAQYTKAIINICLALYATRLVLDALSITDYGIYAVVGSVVTMLGFITNAMTTTTQRYISFHGGRGNLQYVSRTFTNSLFLHIVFGLLLALVLIALEEWLFTHVLNIAPQRIDTARTVYFITILMLMFSFAAAPFKALFIARENIVYISFVEICDGIIKFCFAVMLGYVTADRLLIYAWLMALIQLLNLLAFSLYGKWRFEECRLTIRRRDIDRNILKQIVGFAGWTTYGTASLAARNQGVSVIFNHFLGTTINAAYGIAIQVGNSIFFVSSSIVNAMNPQIMKAEGSGDREKMLMLAGQESKYSTILLAIVSIPLIAELPQLLSLWLKDVPEGTAMFCSFILASCLVDQFTVGLHAANQATGVIRTYSIMTFTPKLLILPAAYVLLCLGYSPVSVMWVYIVIEMGVALSRLPYLQRTCGLDVGAYFRMTILPVLPLIAVMVIVSWLCTEFFHFPFRFLLTMALTIASGLATAWLFCLRREERQYLTNLIKSKLKK